MIKLQPARGSRSRLQHGSSEGKPVCFPSVRGANIQEAAGEVWWKHGGGAAPSDGGAHCGGIRALLLHQVNSKHGSSSNKLANKITYLLG